MVLHLFCGRGINFGTICGAQPKLKKTKKYGRAYFNRGQVAHSYLRSVLKKNLFIMLKNIFVEL